MPTASRTATATPKARPVAWSMSLSRVSSRLMFHPFTTSARCFPQHHWPCHLPTAKLAASSYPIWRGTEQGHRTPHQLHPSISYVLVPQPVEQEGQQRHRGVERRRELGL